jgi:hypothetical protein
MYASYIVGVHPKWGAPGTIRHYTSADLAHWEYESTLDLNVFELGGSYWMLTDEWAGLRVHQDRIFAESGSGEDDGGNGLHADVVVVGDDAFVFYFTHPGRRPGEPASDDLYAHRRTSIQVARAHVAEGRLVCNRDEVLTAPILPPGGP